MLECISINVNVTLHKGTHAEKSDQCLRVVDFKFIRLTFQWWLLTSHFVILYIILVSCTFDENYCGWRDMLTPSNEQISWHRKRSGNHGQGTGPSQDHTGKRALRA